MMELLLREDPSEHMVVEEGRNVHAQGYIGIQNHGSSGADNPDDVYPVSP
jgi:hypothetical protein